MAKRFAWLLPILMSCVAYAQSSSADAPSEQASPITVIVFLVLFIGGCVGYIGFTWWRGRHDEEKD